MGVWGLIRLLTSAATLLRDARRLRSFPCSHFGFFDRPLWSIGAVFFHQLLYLGDDFRVFGGNILLLGEVGLEVIELERLIGLRAHGFPVAHAHSLLKAALVKFPIK